MPGNEVQQKSENKRPTGITLISILFLLVSLFHLLKLVQTIRQWDMLSNLPLTISPLYLAVDGLIWWIAGMSLAAGLWFGKPLARIFSQGISILYSLVFWIDILWIAEPEVIAGRWPFNLVLTAVGLGAILVILNQRSARTYFEKNTATIP
jgi:hypothetical protein